MSKSTSDEKSLAPVNPAKAERAAAEKDATLARAYLDKHPNAWSGGPASRAQAEWLYAWAKDDAVEREGILRTLGSMTAELLGANPTKLEKLLVTRIAVCWMQAHYFDALEGVTASMGRERVPQSAVLGIKRQNAAHRRYLQALKALAEVRRLQSPTMQVNIGDQQVNVASLTAPASPSVK